MEIASEVGQLQQLWDAIFGAARSWYAGKLVFEQALAINHGALHVIAGFVIWLTFAALLRRRSRAWIPLVLTLVIALWNEASDLLIETWPDPVMQYGEAAKDVLLTMAIPVTLAIASRLFPGPNRIRLRAGVKRTRQSNPRQVGKLP